MEKVLLYRSDYVIILRKDASFLKFSNGEVVIYGSWDEAQYDAKLQNGFATSCFSLAQSKKEALIRNIEKYKE